MYGAQQLYSNETHNGNGPCKRRVSFSCAFFAEDASEYPEFQDSYDNSFLDSETSFVNSSFRVDYSEVSALVGEDDGIDELERELERFAASKEKKARKEKRKTENRQMAAAIDDSFHATRRDSNMSLTSTSTASSAPQLTRTRTSSSKCFAMLKANSNNSLSGLNSLRNEEAKATVLLTENELENFNWEGYFVTPQELPEKVATKLAKVMRAQDVDKLRKLWKSGVPMDSCNTQGDTLVHLACRKGSVEILKFLMKEANVSVRVKSNITGKSPLYELCWSHEFNREVTMMLLNDSPELLWAVDKRNFTALDYVPRRSLQEWVDFLEQKGPSLKLALQFNRFKASCSQHQTNQRKLLAILEQRIAPYNSEKIETKTAILPITKAS